MPAAQPNLVQPQHCHRNTPPPRLAVRPDQLVEHVLKHDRQVANPVHGGVEVPGVGGSRWMRPCTFSSASASSSRGCWLSQVSPMAEAAGVPATASSPRCQAGQSPSTRGMGPVASDDAAKVNVRWDPVGLHEGADIQWQGAASLPMVRWGPPRSERITMWESSHESGQLLSR